MVISDKYKYIFYHVPKNAGTSIRAALKEHFEGTKRVYAHTPVEKSVDVLGNEIFKDFFKFAVVRNPYERVVSWYLYLIRESEHGRKKEEIIKPQSFEHFVKYQRFIFYSYKKGRIITWTGTQLSFLSVDGKIGVDYIMRYEYLKNDWNYVCKNLFGKTVELEHFKKWGDPEWEKYYNDETISIVNKIFKDDFKAFDYVIK